MTWVHSNGFVGINTAAPASTLSIGTPLDGTTNYAQIDTLLADTAGPPAATDCDAATEVGRMVQSSRYSGTADQNLWRCTKTGASSYAWVTTGADLTEAVGFGDETETGNKPMVVWLKNNTGVAVSSGMIVVASGANGISTTTTASASTVIGIVYEPAGIADGAVGRIAVGGIVRAICAEDTAIGEHVMTSTTAGAAQGFNAPSSGTTIGRWLEACDVDTGGSGNVLLR